MGGVPDLWTAVLIGMQSAAVFIYAMLLFRVAGRGHVRHPFLTIAGACIAIATALLLRPESIVRLAGWPFPDWLALGMLLSGTTLLLIGGVAWLSGIEVARCHDGIETRLHCPTATRIVMSNAAPIPVFILLAIGAYGWNG